MTSKHTYKQIDSTAQKLKELEDKSVISKTDVLLRPEQTFMQSKAHAEDLYNLYQVVKASLIKDNVMEALKDDLEDIKAGDIYIAGDVDDVDKKARKMILKVYEEAY